MKRGNLRILVCVSIVAFFLGALCTVAAGEEKDLFEGKTVNINTATVEDFVKNTPIPLEIVQKIVEYRDEMGDFMVIEELLQIEGFTRTLLKKVKEFLLLEGLGGDECTC